MSANPRPIQSNTREFRLLIDGQLTEGTAALEVINPATGRLLTTCSRAD